MSALEEMRPFFRFCQFLGLLPFRMEIDMRTGKFRQFSFSWQNPITWWCVALSLIQLAIYYIFMSPVLEDPELSKLPTTINISLSISGVIYFVVDLSSRYWLTVRFFAFRKATQLMRQVEQNLEEHPDCKCTIKRRMIFGLAITFSYVANSYNLNSLNYLNTWIILITYFFRWYSHFYYPRKFCTTVSVECGANGSLS